MLFIIRQWGWKPCQCNTRWQWILEDVAVFCRDSQQHHAYTVTQGCSAWNLLALVPSTSSTATAKLSVLYPCCQSGSQDGASPGPSWEAARPLGGVLSPVLLPQLWGSQCFPPCDTQVVAMPWQVHALSRSMSAAGDMEIPRHHQSNWGCCSCSREMVRPFWELQCKLSQSQVITTWLHLPCPSSEDCYVFLPLSPCPRKGLAAPAARTPHQPHRRDLPLSFRPPVSAPKGKSRTGAGLNHHNLLVSWRQRWSKKVWIISVLCRHRNTTAEGAEAIPALLQQCHRATLYELTSSLILYWNQRKLLWLVTDVHLIFYYATLTMDFNCRNISTLPPSPPPPSSWFIFHCVVLYHDKNEHWQALSLLTLMYTLHLQCEMWARFGHWAVTDLQLITSVHHPDCCQANELILWTPIHSPLPLPISTEAEYLGPSQKLGFLSEVRRGKERTTQRKDLLLHQSWCWS